uniref:FtsX-like permease family protein n=1 Tax=Promineifilum sp. TaxID=2664178 RepID=UPI0035AFB12B
MSTLWLKTLRDLWLFKARTLLVVLAIAVGTAAVGVSATSLVVLRRDLRDGYRNTNPAHAILDTSPFDVALAEQVAKLPEVVEAQARRRTEARLVLDDGSIRPLSLWTIPDFAGLFVGTLASEPGANVPPPSGALLLERSARPGLPLEQGDAVTVRLSDGDVFRLPVAGFVNDLSQAPTTVQPTVYGYLSDDTAVRLGLPAEYNQLHLTVAAANPDRAAVETAVTAVTEWLEDEGVAVLRAGIPEPGVHLMQGNVDTGLLMIGILGGLTLLLSAFLVTNVMSAVIAQQVPQIGVLKALGGGRGLVLRQYGRMVVIFGGLALLLAVPLGLWGAYFQSTFLAGQLNFDIPSFGLPAMTLLVQVAGALLVPAVAALWPVRAAANMTIREALGGQGIGALARSGLLSRLDGLPRLAALALRNVARRKVRLGLTLIALSLAGAMFIATFGLRLGLYEAVEILVSEFPYDVQIDFAAPEPVRRLEREAAGIAGVERVEAWGVADARRVYPDGRVGSSFPLYGVPPTTAIAAFANRAGRWLSAGNGAGGTGGFQTRPYEVYINYETEKLTHRPAVGDELALKLNGDRERETQLIGISLRPFEAGAYMAYADFEQATGVRGRAGRLVVYLDGDDPARQTAVAAELVARYEAAGM